MRSKNEHIIDAYPEDKSISFREFIDRLKQIYSFLWKRRVLIIGISFILSLTVALTTFFSKKKFIAEITFGIDESVTGKTNSMMSKYAGLIEKFGFGESIMGSGLSLISPNNLPILFHSKNILYRVLTSKIKNDRSKDSTMILSLWLESYPIKNHEKVCNIFLNNLHKDLGEDVERDSIYQNIYQMIAGEKSEFIKLDKTETGSSVYDLKVTTNNQFLSYYLAKTLLKKVTEYYIFVNTQRITSQIEYLENQLSGVSQKYFNKLQSAVSKNLPNLNSAIYYTDPKIVSDQEMLDIQKVTFSSILSNLETLKLEQKKETPIFFILDDTMLPLKIEKKSTISTFILSMFVFTFVVCFLLLALKYFRMAYYQHGNSA